MSGSGGGSQTVQKSTSEPWSGIKDQSKQISNEAQRLYNSGVGPSYYPGATYVGPTNDEMAGQSQIEQLALNGSGLSGGLLNNLQGPLADIISGKNQITAPGVGENNKYVMPVLDYAANKAKDAVNSSFGGMGRYGAPEQGGTLGREVGNIYSTGLRDQMNTDISRQMQAQGANIANRAGAISSYAQMAPGAEESRYWDANKLIGVGAAQRGELQTELQSNIDRWNAAQSRPWDQLNMYNNIISGMGGMGSSQFTSVPRGSPFLGLLGGGMAGYGLGNSMFPGIGGLLGGGLGGLAGLFS